MDEAPEVEAFLKKRVHVRSRFILISFLILSQEDVEYLIKWKNQKGLPTWKSLEELDQLDIDYSKALQAFVEGGKKKKPQKSQKPAAKSEQNNQQPKNTKSQKVPPIGTLQCLRQLTSNEKVTNLLFSVFVFQILSHFRQMLYLFLCIQVLLKDFRIFCIFLIDLASRNHFCIS